MKMFKKLLFAGLVLFYSARIFGADSTEVSPIFSGYGFLEDGQIEKGIGSIALIDHAWIQDIVAGLLLDKTIKKHTRIILQGEGEVAFSYATPISELGKETSLDMPLARYTYYVRQAEGRYTLGTGDSIQYPFQVGVGIFPYKYNPEVRNLGEYLYRAVAYPTYFYNQFDAPYDRLAGIKLSTKPVENFRLDALITSEINLPPLQDFSLSFVADYSAFKKFLDIGAGIDFDRLFSVNNSFTTPSTGQAGTNNVYSRDSIGYDASSFLTTYGNQKYYTFASTKIMARLTLDPKVLIPSDMFGKEDLKLYSEAAILGLQNYPAHNISHADYYDTLSQRIPFMVGFNIPTFKFLDVLCAEVEYFKNPYPPSYDYAFRQGWPRPLDDKTAHPSDVNWSFYAKRTLGSFSLIGQIAKDHFQPNVNHISLSERTDVLPEAGDWWWVLKVGFSF